MLPPDASPRTDESVIAVMVQLPLPFDPLIDEPPDVARRPTPSEHRVSKTKGQAQLVSSRNVNTVW